jgi:hypothetical protein
MLNAGPLIKGKIINNFHFIKLSISGCLLWVNRQIEAQA